MAKGKVLLKMEETRQMILYVRDQWKQAFITFTNGDTVFLTQLGKSVHQMTLYYDSTSSTAFSKPTHLTVHNSTVRKRVEAILRQHSKELKIIPLGMIPQQIALTG